MKKLLTLTVMCLVAIAAFALEKADIEVSYNYEYPNYRTAVRGSQNQYILLANGTNSKFFSPKTEYIDSLKSTAEGMAKLNEMTNNAMINGNYDDIPRADGAYYVIKSVSDNKLYNYETVGMDKLYSEEPIDVISWEICDSTKSILGYECVKAYSEFHGRKWNVWFAPEIPIQAGPWKLSGLPGLILDAESDDKMYLFVVTGIEQTAKQIGHIYLSDNYEKVSRKEMLKAKRAYFDNPLGNINSQLSGKDVTVSIQDEKGNSISGTQGLFATREEVDFIEIDY